MGIGGIGYWVLGIGYWVLGYWLLVIGYWLLALLVIGVIGYWSYWLFTPCKAVKGNSVILYDMGWTWDMGHGTCDMGHDMGHGTWDMGTWVYIWNMEYGKQAGVARRPTIY